MKAQSTFDVYVSFSQTMNVWKIRECKEKSPSRDFAQLTPDSGTRAKCWKHASTVYGIDREHRRVIPAAASQVNNTHGHISERDTEERRRAITRLALS